MVHQLVGRMRVDDTGAVVGEHDRDAGALQVPTESTDDRTARSRERTVHVDHGFAPRVAVVVAQTRGDAVAPRRRDFGPDICERRETWGCRSLGLDVLV